MTNYEQVKLLNTLAGNIATGDWKDILKQFNIISLEVKEMVKNISEGNHEGVRDDICDVLVTTYGLAVRMGLNSDKDMLAVMKALFTRFDLNEEDARLTKEKYLGWGVETYTHIDSLTNPGTIYYVTKSAKDQTGLNAKGEQEFYPKDKFLKSHNTRSEEFEPMDEKLEARLKETVSATEGWVSPL